jgi:hypothetical protein
MSYDFMGQVGAFLPQQLQSIIQPHFIPAAIAINHSTTLYMRVQHPFFLSFSGMLIFSASSFLALGTWPCCT